MAWYRHKNVSDVTPFMAEAGKRKMFLPKQFDVFLAQYAFHRVNTIP